MTPAPQSDVRKTRFRTAPIIAVMGCFPLIQFFNKPRAELFHPIDIIQLMVSGFIFGVAFAFLMTSLKATREHGLLGR